MTIAEMLDLQPGDQVRIIQSWDEQEDDDRSDGEGLMDKFLGTVMTVREVHENYCYMEEDQTDRRGRVGWLWYHDMIAWKTDDEIEFDDSLFAELPPISDLWG